MLDVEISKNKDLEKQIKYFQSTVAQAFAERDSLITKCERAVESEEAATKKLSELEDKLTECESAYHDQMVSNEALEMELSKLKANSESCFKIVEKFYEIHQRETGYSLDMTFEDKCAFLQDCCSDDWEFHPDGATSTSKYIESLEQENRALKGSIVNLQNNLREGLEIEQLLKRDMSSLQKKQKTSYGLIENQISALQKFCTEKKTEITKMLEEEESHLKAFISDACDKLCQNYLSSLKEDHYQQQECQINDVEGEKEHDPYNELSKALSQAMSEKVEALMRLSQQEERLLLENESLRQKIADLEKNLNQTKREKVETHSELATLKKEYQLLKEGSKDGWTEGDGFTNGNVSAHDQGGKLTKLLRKVPLPALRNLVMKDSKLEVSRPSSSTGTSHESRTDSYAAESARLKIENAALQESIINIEHLTSSIHRLRNLLVKVFDDIKSGCLQEIIHDQLDSIIMDANRMKTALMSTLPISWSVEAYDTIMSETSSEVCDSPTALRIDKVESLVGPEIMEVIIFAAGLLSEFYKEKVSHTT